MVDWLGIVAVFSFSATACAVCQHIGRRQGMAQGRREGYEEGYSRGLVDGVHGEQGKAIVDMLRDNVAKNIEKKIREEYRNGTRKP